SAVFVFFFQAEDGIRDKLVTGVQTCALPISREGPVGISPRGSSVGHHKVRRRSAHAREAAPLTRAPATDSVRRCARAFCARYGRSEERRVGKEGRTRGARSRREEKKTNATVA